jgi:hypothetical protein
MITSKRNIRDLCLAKIPIVALGVQLPIFLRLVQVCGLEAMQFFAFPFVHSELTGAFCEAR